MDKALSNNERARRALEDEMYSSEEYIKYQREKNIKLKEELEIMSGYIDEDEKIIDTARNYVEMHGDCLNRQTNDEQIDELYEIYAKMDVLHLQLCNTTKKFVKAYFPQLDEDDHSKISSRHFEQTSQIPDEFGSAIQSGSRQSKGVTITNSKQSSEHEKCTPKKSLLDILKQLTYDLNPLLDNEYREMIVDDTIRPRDIKFLKDAGIVKESSENPAQIELIRRCITYEGKV